MINGMSGSLVSHDALEELWQAPDSPLTRGMGCGAHAHLRPWHASVRSRLGPTAGARTVFDTVAEPLLRSLGYDVSLVHSGGQAVSGVLTVHGVPAAAVIAVPWIVPLRSVWRQAVHCGLAHEVRWTIAVNGNAICAFDVRRAYARRRVEFDLDHALEFDRSRAVLCALLGAGALGERGELDGLQRVVDHCERHRAAVRLSLRSGVHDAVLQLASAFRLVASQHSDSHLLTESLIVLYRLLFLLFAEARGLVPTWHPVYRDSYTIDTMVRQLERKSTPDGIWETFQALSRLAHRGCRAGPLRVPPFNGRLFSPASAPLAARVSLSDTVVRNAILALTTTEDGGGRRRISYADLGVEQLGAVYEHLLDFVVRTRGDPGGPRMVATGRRKATGSFYTPRPLTEFVVRRALAAVVQGKSSDEILALRVLDPAMGSGAFLVSACRYLAGAYEHALIREGIWTTSDVGEQERAGFRRAVAQRCLFGVDINPMAVQLARLSMWLATLAADKPLTFLDHRLRIGHSLIGASIDDVIRRPFPGKVASARDLPLFPADDLAASMESAGDVRRAIAETPDDTLDQVRGKERRLHDLEKDDGPMARWRAAADLWCAAWVDRRVASDRRVFGALLDHILQGHGPLPAHVSAPALAQARQVAAGARVFNWAIEFPEVFGPQPGGFDVVFGNPPWDVVREDREDGAGSGLADYVKGSGQYGLQGNGHPNLYQLFFERGLRLLKPGGRCALILPSGFATDHGCGRLRRHLFERTEVDTFTTIDNRDGLFPIHRSLKFLLLSFTTDRTTVTLPIRSGVRSVDSLDCVPDSGVDPGAIALPRATVARASGEGLEVPDLRSRLDLEIVSAIGLHVPASADPAGWHIHFGRELNATDDRPHFTERHGLPIVEGKQLRPFGVDAAPPRFRIPRQAAAMLLDPERTFARARLAYRDVASPTNRTTLIAAIVPGEMVTTHTVFCVRETIEEEEQQFLCGVFNSYVANYLVRMRVGTHVTTAIVARLPVPKPARGDPMFAAVAGAARVLAAGWDAAVFARLNAAVAHLYALAAHEFAHVVGNFPLVDLSERAAAVAEFQRIAPRAGGQAR